MRTLIKGGTIVTASDTYDADVLIEDEKIVTIGHGLAGDTTIDAARQVCDPRRHRRAYPPGHALRRHGLVR